MESGAFLDERVQEEFGRFVGIVLHTDGTDDMYGPSSRRNKAMQRERFKTTALPLYVILNPSGEKVLWRHAGTLTAEELLEALRGVQD